MNDKTINRLSGIELLKIIAMFFIVLAHMTNTFSTGGESIGYVDYALHVGNSTKDIQIFIMSIFMHLGLLGNDMFFVSSAWFFVGKEENNKKKLFEMVVERWIISITILIISYINLHGAIEIKTIITCLFPTLFSSNWYITCYILFCLVYPYLNKLINRFNRKTLFRFCLVMTFCYVLCNFIRAEQHFEFSRLLLWFTIYFIMAYLKNYHINLCNNVRFNKIVLFISISLGILLSLITNILGFHVSYFSDKLLKWCNNSNPIFILIAISSFNVFRNIKFKNKTINYISSLTMFIYVIHENLIIRTYYRPILVDYAYHMFGFSKVVLLDLILSIIWFVGSLLLSIFFDKVIRKLLRNKIDQLYLIIKTKYIDLESKYLRSEE